jgi:uncharacterized membrane protein YphA (DoxX/SURF4 family)
VPKSKATAVATGSPAAAAVSGPDELDACWSVMVRSVRAVHSPAPAAAAIDCGAMTPSQFAATNILPLLARLVLCLAFLPQGWNNLMRDVEYTGPDARRLRELGVRGITDPDPAKSDVALGAVRGWPAGPWQAPQEPAGKEPAATQEPGAEGPAEAEPTATAAPAPAAPKEPRPARASAFAPLTQRGLYTLSLLIDRASIPFPVEVAWGAAAVQLVGGACALLGMFTRIWGLLMSVMLAGLFVMTALPGLKASGPFSMGADLSNLVFAQLGLFVLSLGLFLIGPGAMSLDRAIFRRSRRPGAKPKQA